MGLGVRLGKHQRHEIYAAFPIIRQVALWWGYRNCAACTELRDEGITHITPPIRQRDHPLLLHSKPKGEFHSELYHSAARSGIH